MTGDNIIWYDIIIWFIILLLYIMKKLEQQIENDFNLSFALEGLLYTEWFNKFKPQLAFLYEYLDENSYGYECMNFQNEEHFLSLLNSWTEIALWVDSLSTEGEDELKSILIGHYWVDILRKEAIQIEKEYEILCHWTQEQISKLIDDSAGSVL